MNPLRLLFDITAPWDGFHAWGYERVVAPAACDAQMDVLDEHLLRHLARGASLLDVGAGGGTMTARVAALRPDLAITAVEPSEPQRARAERRLAGRARVQPGTAADPGVPDGSFDAVLACLSLKHWPDRVAGLRACVRALRPGGVLLATELDRSCTSREAAAFVARWPAPRALGPLLALNFRKFVAGQSIDEREARRIASAASTNEAHIARLPSAPILFITIKA